jgi:ABC-type branched-subunit amino acid transport system substrate-binding protein
MAKFEQQKNEIERITKLSLKLLVRDSQATDANGEKGKALAHARELVEKHKVVAILGAVNSHATMAVQDYVESLNGPNTVLITSSSTNTAITAEPNNWTFRNNLSDQKLTKGLAKRMYGEGLKKVAVFYHNGVWGQGASQDFKEEFTELGGEVLYQKPLSKEEIHFGGEMLEIESKNITAICIFAGDFSKYKILKAKMKNSWTKALPVFTIGLPHRLEEAGGQFMKNLTAATSYTDRPINSRVETAKNILDKSLDEDIPPWSRLHLNFNSARAMESMEILLQAIAATKSTDPAVIRDTIRKTTFQGINYEIKFNPVTGDLMHMAPFYLEHHKNEWHDLNNLWTYQGPILHLMGIALLALFTYFISYHFLKLNAKHCLLIAVLPVMVLLKQSESSISISETLGNLSQILTWCTSIVTLLMLASQVIGRVMELKNKQAQSKTQVNVPLDDQTTYDTDVSEALMTPQLLPRSA